MNGIINNRFVQDILSRYMIVKITPISSLLKPDTIG